LLYVWRDDSPTYRFAGGARSGGWQGNRLSFGELAQPPDIVEPGGVERFVYPDPSSTAVWLWETQDRGRIARLIEPNGEDGTEIASRNFREGSAPKGVTASGSLIVDALNEALIAIDGEGTEVSIGSGTLVAIAGDETLVQRCNDTSCARRWVDAVTGATRDAGTDNRVWVSVAGPSIPGHSTPLPSASPGGEQILVGTRSLDQGSSDPLTEWLRVDVATNETERVPLTTEPVPALATWSRDGRFVVVIGSDAVQVVDLATEVVASYEALVPDGFFVLAAG